MALHPDIELVLRIVVGTVLGGIIGYERDLHGRPAGLRTHAIVALASATFMVVSTQLVYYQHYHPGDFIEVDGSRIAASVVSGIGFLAAGAILRNGFTVQGLTTAAGLWLVAAIGLCAGGGMFIESVAATVIGVAVLTIMRRFEDKDDRVVRRLVLTLSEAAAATELVIARLVELDVAPALEGWSTEVGGATRRLVFGIRLPRDGGEARLVAALHVEPGVAGLQLEQPT